MVTKHTFSGRCRYGSQLQILGKTAQVDIQSSTNDSTMLRGLINLDSSRNRMSLKDYYYLFVPTEYLKLCIRVFCMAACLSP
jgi:hypothetical protein